MASLSPFILFPVLMIWLFGLLQRFFALRKYGKTISTSDYVHAGMSYGILLIPAFYFYLYGIPELYLFLSGFAFAYIISTAASILMSLMLVSRIMKNPLNAQTLALYGIFFSMPVTIAIMATGLYLANPFVIGAACAIASSWIGYMVQL